jgi:NitT/TauT family transport system permease protein
MNIWIRGGQVALLLVILTGLEFLVKSGIVGDLYLAPTSRIAAELALLLKNPDFYGHIATTLMEFLIGMAASVILGIAIGLLVGRSEMLENFTRPYLSGLMAVPKVAIIPLLTIWLGIGLLNKATLVFIFAFFPIVYNTMTGVKQVPENYLKVARVFRATPVQLVAKVILPSAIPTIFAGIRVAAATGLVGAIFGEMMASKAGLGNLLTTAAQLYNTGQLFAIIVITTLLSVLIIQGVDLIEKGVFLRWRSRS